MIFAKPLQFDEALKFARSKQLLPTNLSSAELRELDAALKQRSAFSARVTDGGFIDRFDKLVEKIAGGPDESDFEERLAGRKPLLMSIPEAKAQLRQYLDEIGYAPENPDDEGTVKDLRTDLRLQLIVETNTLDTLGFGRWAASQNTVTLDAYPAWELVRMRFSKVPRDWEERWEAARRATVEDGATPPGGRLIALKNHPIWLALGEGAGGFTDTLGNPWPPFAFNSGMNVIDVSREVAVELDLCTETTRIKPEKPGQLNENLQASVKGFATALQKAVAGGRFKLEDGILMANEGGLSLVRNRVAAFSDALDEVMLANGSPDEPRDANGRWVRRQIAKDIKSVRKAYRISKNQKRDIPGIMKRGPYTVDLEHGIPGTMRKGIDDDGYGTAHLDYQHSADVGRFPVTLARGSWHEHENPDKIYIVHGDDVAILGKAQRADGTYSQTRLKVISHYKTPKTARRAMSRTVLLEGR